MTVAVDSCCRRRLFHQHENPAPRAKHRRRAIVSDFSRVLHHHWVKSIFV